MNNHDVVIVGGGIGGSSLAATLARAGLSVAILERETEFVDRVRGEWISPWGVVELQRLGLYQPFLNGGGHHISRAISFDDVVTHEESALAEPSTLTDILPGVPGPLSMQHVSMQNIALDAASRAGASVYLGVSKVAISPGDQGFAKFKYQGKTHQLNCRLIVGADGRNSTVRKQCGIELNTAPLERLMTGLLLEADTEWPDDMQAIGRQNGLYYLLFPQGDKRFRLYADFPYERKHQFGGTCAAETLLAAFSIEGMPSSWSISAGKPAGPCRTFPSQDAWTEVAHAKGVVLIGDAAGYNDPINGQGLSVTLRDSRMISEILVGDENWSEERFAQYSEDRKERLRRLRFLASFVGALRVGSSQENIERSKRAFESFSRNSELAGVLRGLVVGPEKLNEDFFTLDFYKEVFGTEEGFIA